MLYGSKSGLSASPAGGHHAQHGGGHADLVTADPDEPRGIAWEAEPVQLTQNTPGVPGRVRRATDSAVPSPWPT
jgi:hypothetical protein